MVPTPSKSISASKKPRTVIQCGKTRVCIEIVELVIMNTPAIFIAYTCII
jgi:hypothetical protein